MNAIIDFSSVKKIKVFVAVQYGHIPGFQFDVYVCFTVFL